MKATFEPESEAKTVIPTEKVRTNHRNIIQRRIANTFRNSGEQLITVRTQLLTQFSKGKLVPSGKKV